MKSGTVHLPDEARRIAEKLSAYYIFDINPNDLKTNIFYLRFNTEDKSIPQKFVDLLKENDVLVYPPRNGEIRLVTHYDVKECDIDKLISLIPQIVKQLK